MPRRKEWTDDQLRVAVAQSRSWRATAATLDLAPGSTHRVKRRAGELALDASHMVGNRRWNRDRLRQAVEVSSSWCEVAAHLGVPETDTGRIKGAARRFGIDVRGLDGTQPGLRDAVDVTPRLSRLPQAAEPLACAWFVMSGHQVSLPAGPCIFDMVVSSGSEHRRVQVKATTHRDREGRWVVVVARRPYRRESSGGREPYDPDEIDAFFIINGCGECFFIPIGVVAGRVSIVLDSYREYCVGTIGSLFSHR